MRDKNLSRRQSPCHLIDSTPHARAATFAKVLGQPPATGDSSLASPQARLLGLVRAQQSVSTKHTRDVPGAIWDPRLRVVTARHAPWGWTSSEQALCPWRPVRDTGSVSTAAAFPE